MPKYVIERELPGAGSLSSEELAAISCRSNEVLAGMHGRAQWLHSYVTDDRIICLYVADDPEAIREHGRIGPFPVTAIRRVVEVIDPTSAEAATVAGGR
jgi:hypothetical protein